MKIDIHHIAQLANLPLNDSEMKIFERQLSSILDYVKQLEKVDTGNVSETNNITGLENIQRSDLTQPSLSQDEALSGVKKQHNGFLIVDAILEG